MTNPITGNNPSWTTVIIAIEGVFLQGHFKSNEELHIEVLDGFEKWYPGDVVLKMNIPLYGTKQATYCFFQTFKR